MKRLILIVLAGVIFGMVPGLAAQEPDGDVPVTDDDVNEVASELYCPVCENIPLDACGTAACVDWRAEIRGLLEEGYTDDEVKAYFADRYGRRVLAQPEQGSFDQFLWVLPVVGVIAGAVMLGVTLRRVAPLEATTGIDMAYDDLEEEYVQRLEREVRDFS